jgi:hypothetical protein
MNRFMVALMIAIGLQGCATTRSKNNDHVLTVYVDKASFPDQFYPRVVEALTKNSNFRVLETGSGFQSVSAGGKIVGSVQCSNRASMWKAQGYLNCLQVLTIVDLRTTEAVASVSHEEDSGEAFWGEQRIAPSFERVVEKLWDAYPRRFENSDRSIASPAVSTSEEMR